MTDAHTGCRSWPDDVAEGDNRVALSAQQLVRAPHRQLVVHTRDVEHCGEFKNAFVYARRGGELAELLALDLGGEQGCGPGEWPTTARVTVPHPGELIVEYHRRARHYLGGDDDAMSPWQDYRARCRYVADGSGTFVPDVPGCYDHLRFASIASTRR
jgi:hypothetical protein